MAFVAVESNYHNSNWSTLKGYMTFKRLKLPVFTLIKCLLKNFAVNLTKLINKRHL